MKADQRPDVSYLPQLDGLRAVAIAFVFFWHFYKIEALPGKWAIIPYGEIGVRLFFVLSGFLITGILLRARAAGDRGTAKKPHLIRQFYIRRFLRISPLYYFVLVVALFLGIEPVRQIFAWLFTYTTNILMVLKGEDSAGWFAHFWSLAVEEQFYLFWPWVVLLAPIESLLPIILAMIATGPLYRWFASSHQITHEAVLLLTPATFDALGLGALLAWLVDQKRYSVELEKRLFPILMSLGAAGAGLLMLRGRNVAFDVGFYFMLGLMGFCLVGRAAKGYADGWGRLLEATPLTYVGKISYGLYVYHYLFVPLLSDLFRQLRWWDHIRGIRFVALGSLASLGVASLSWFLFEKPINQLKRYFT